MLEKETLEFLKRLDKNNNREWFNAHKDQFIAAKENIAALTGYLISQIAKFDPAISGTLPEDCVFRIYRDIRFSKNKNPYKNNLGAYIAPGVVCMPPMYVNAGAYVDEGTMIDSHALVGSCAQIGKRVHISAAAQIGGVLEPVGAVPVIIEDDVLVGGNCGVYEGTIVRERAVLATGTVLTGSTPVYDLVRNEIYQRKPGAPLEIPAGAVVVPGARAIQNEPGLSWGLSLYAAIIVKYRDEKTEAAVQLEDYLR